MSRFMTVNEKKQKTAAAVKPRGYLFTEADDFGPNPLRFKRNWAIAAVSNFKSFRLRSKANRT